MRGFTLALMARRLREAGHEVCVFDYASVTRRPEAGLARIAEYIAALPAGKVHLVGHSLGGLMAMELARTGCNREGGRVVCMGTPLSGSAVARVLAGWTPLRWTLGEARQWLCEGLAEWPGETSIGMIAGSMPFGFGVFIPGLSSPHDGTVAVAETRDDRLAGHVIVHASHSGLLLSQRVATLTAAFLARGAFDPAC